MGEVAAAAPSCAIIGFDLWVQEYASMPNPGPDFVKDELRRIGHTGEIELISGDSHETVPKFLASNPNAFFDLVTVDGDHSRHGAGQDLAHVLPRLRIGGVIVFDDIAHPAHPYLLNVWQKLVQSDSRFGTWQFTELGYGVALAVRKH
jgi:predicted O-methyltransferase YrrM